MPRLGVRHEASLPSRSTSQQDLNSTGTIVLQAQELPHSLEIGGFGFPSVLRGQHWGTLQSILHRHPTTTGLRRQVFPLDLGSVLAHHNFGATDERQDIE